MKRKELNSLYPFSSVKLGRCVFLMKNAFPSQTVHTRPQGQHLTKKRGFKKFLKLNFRWTLFNAKMLNSQNNFV